MRVNFFVEDLFFFRYIGCATVAKTLYKGLQGFDGLSVRWKSRILHHDLIHYHTFGPFASINRRLSRGIKVLTAHSTPRINEGNIAMARTFNRWYPRIYRNYDHIITISRPCHREVTAMVPDMPATLIPNGVNREIFRRDEAKRQAFREVFGIGEDERAVLTVAQQTPRKGLFDFLSLAHLNPDIRWIWVGGFPYGAFSKNFRQIRRIRQRCGSNVIFTGYIGDITAAYSGADIFFMPSYAETFGLVVLEALASGLPVIARDIPEFRDIFGDSILYFADRGGAASLLGDEQAVRLCRAGARDASAPFDIRTVAARHRDLYYQILEDT